MPKSKVTEVADKCTVVEIVEMGTIIDDIVTPPSSPYLFSTILETHLDIDDVLNTLKYDGSLNGALKMGKTSLFLINMTHIEMDIDKIVELSNEDAQSYIMKRKENKLTLTLLYTWNGIDPFEISVPDVYHYLETVMSIDYIKQITAPYSLDVLLSDYETQEYFEQ